MTKIILASGSPRRKALLKQAGLSAEVHPSAIEEKITKTLPPDIVKELSAQKASAVAEEVIDGVFVPFSDDPKAAAEGVIVLGADTVVALDGKVLGKPGTEEKAVEMLHFLQGRTHHVYTGVTLILVRDSEKAVSDTFFEETAVHVVPMTDEEILEYVHTGDPLDKAGAYGIQGMFARYISGIEGSYNNVVGLPVCGVYQSLKKWKKDGLIS